MKAFCSELKVFNMYVQLIGCPKLQILNILANYIKACKEKSNIYPYYFMLNGES